MSRPNTLMAMVADENKRLTALFSDPWDLPIVFTVEGDIIRGTLHMELGADLNAISVEDAKKYIGLGFQQALLRHIERMPLDA